ncbi:MAG: hypothetical protein AVDCRST_MAG52-2388 [uncultured Blastococcus sp.]|uniref:Uncharacterized protein n=1 Tax=uncultured Blastococcus sp. TaxID=217144 RepID=A0A6J4IFG9_9ACTN|nr:MAG: hypothetical protein AVDCRST_MAG52-2388 [uncultured Blastococcus sp.]
MTAAAAPSRQVLTRLMAAAGAATGVVLLTRPLQVVDTIAPAFPIDKLWLVRALGARLVAQHGAVLVSASPRLVRLGSAVDLIHAATMVPFLASPRYGPAARISGGLAAAYAAVALVVAPRD